MSKGLELIAIERQKQIDKHGFTAEHHFNNDEWYDQFQLQEAAYTLLAKELYEQDESHLNVPKNWDGKWFLNLYRRNRTERLIIAGALIAAELDRLHFVPVIEEEKKIDLTPEEFVRKEGYVPGTLLSQEDVFKLLEKYSKLSELSKNL